MTTNEWYNATKYRDSYRLSVVWALLENPNAEPARIQNPTQKLEHIKREIVEARFNEIPAEVVLKFNYEEHEEQLYIGRNRKGL